MNRRAFFGSIAGLLAGASIDTERMLWRPGKLISIPKPAPVGLSDKEIYYILERRMECAYQEMNRLLQDDIKAMLNTPLIGGSYSRGSEISCAPWDGSKYATYGTVAEYVK